MGFGRLIGRGYMKQVIPQKTVQMINYAVGGINFFLLLRLLFKAFGANTFSPIVSVTYSLSDALLIPFRGIFDPAVSGQSVIEPSILVAMLIYSVLARAAVELMAIMADGEENEAKEVDYEMGFE
ncbi:MAG: hypothetical protein UX85_C0004G0196 [Candidatus Beckwithbacteria bacterium GW2011_GWB1_47_15]|uniref:YGGT family protein n=1 Tax=Candidatus Beckwithbacteria bacterium GW2011_GWB1_47_15 TaxID=1618371 RepID=A0A0G1RVE0_9BACT|nr:MAG: hypothetical protein UX85_C0004G0196 [Candidatus Beckwithbacteria bacterium GW2011_GWB1_47_15]